MDYTKGEDRILFIKIDGAYMPIGCLIGNSLDENVQMLDTTTRDNKGWVTGRPVAQDYSISFNGLQLNSTMPGGNFNVASYDRLKIIKRKKILIDWKIQGTVFPVVDYGKAYITNIGEANNVGEFMSFSGTLTGYGEPLVQDLGGVVLNNGDPNVLIITEDNNLIKVS